MRGFPNSVFWPVEISISTRRDIILWFYSIAINFSFEFHKKDRWEFWQVEDLMSRENKGDSLNLTIPVCSYNRYTEI